MWTDGRTDATNLIVAFRDFANVLKYAILGNESNKILGTEGKHWLKHTASDRSGLECSAMSLAQPRSLQGVTDLVNMPSAHNFHINIISHRQTIKMPVYIYASLNDGDPF